MQHFWEQVEVEEYSIYSVCSTSENGISWNTGDTDGLWTFNP